MTQRASNLLAEALRLPENDRARLAADLIESLDAEADDDVDSAWSLEIQRRIEDIQSGRVMTVPWAEARRLIVEQADGDAAD